MIIFFFFIAGDLVGYDWIVCLQRSHSVRIWRRAPFWILLSQAHICKFAFFIIFFLSMHATWFHFQYRARGSTSRQRFLPPVSTPLLGCANSSMFVLVALVILRSQWRILCVFAIAFRPLTWMARSYLSRLLMSERTHRWHSTQTLIFLRFWFRVWRKESSSLMTASMPESTVSLSSLPLRLFRFLPQCLTCLHLIMSRRTVNAFSPA